MKHVIASFCLLAVVLLAAPGCSRRAAADCSSAEALSAVVPLVQDRLANKIRQQIRSTDGSRPASLARVRATVSQANLRIEDVRTTQSDPNSTRRFCVGRLKVTFPEAVLDGAERARQAASTSNVSQLAESADIDRNANTFTADIEYNVQPTDDGSRVYAELDNADPYLNFHSEVLASYLMRPVVEEARREQDRAAAEQRRAEEEQRREQESALAEQRSASLQQARSEHRLAEQTLFAVWRAVPPDTRRQLTEIQLAWARRRDADCRIEGAATSTDANEREAARLRCLARLNNGRIPYLRQYATGY